MTEDSATNYSFLSYTKEKCTLAYLKKKKVQLYPKHCTVQYFYILTMYSTVLWDIIIIIIHLGNHYRKEHISFPRIAQKTEKLAYQFYTLLLIFALVSRGGVLLVLAFVFALVLVVSVFFSSSVVHVPLLTASLRTKNRGGLGLGTVSAEKS